MARQYGVPVFRKTSCLFSYVHGLGRDYNAHYYRPSELGCENCVMKNECHSYKEHLSANPDLSDVIPFDYQIVEKENHVCVLMKNGMCEFPTADCAKISGKIIKIDEPLTTSDVRVIKWLTGYTVDADFYESPYINEKWVENKTLTKKR